MTKLSFEIRWALSVGGFDECSLSSNEVNKLSNEVRARWWELGVGTLVGGGEKAAGWWPDGGREVARWWQGGGETAAGRCRQSTGGVVVRSQRRGSDVLERLGRFGGSHGNLCSTVTITLLSFCVLCG